MSIKHDLITKHFQVIFWEKNSSLFIVPWPIIQLIKSQMNLKKKPQQMNTVIISWKDIY